MNEQLSAHFWKVEFGNTDVKFTVLPSMLTLLESVREYFGNQPIMITDGIRTMARHVDLYQKKHPGVDSLGTPKWRKVIPYKSGHLFQVYNNVLHACDFSVKGSSAEEVQEYVTSKYDRFGVRGIGCGLNFTHVDFVKRSHNNLVKWGYGNNP